MKSFILISHRLPFTVPANENDEIVRISSTRGLVTALTPLIVKTNGYWIGCAGNELTDKIPESFDEKSIAHELKSSQIVPVFLSESLNESYYNGMCKGSLWPLLHSLPSHSSFNSENWNSYVEVNEIFSDLCLETLKKTNKENLNDITSGDLVWIHDYHLLILPMMLKNLIEEAQIACKIAFFLHVPFPSWDVFRLNPWAKETLLGLLGCDLIGFHTNSYAINFLDCCFHILGTRINKEDLTIEYGNKIILVRALPIGVSFDWFEKQARIASKQFSFIKEKVILGVDRLDYTKGIIQRVLGYEKFLEKYPEYLEKVVFCQIAVPSRTDIDEYKTLKDELEREVGRVSGRFGTPEWTPIKYIYKILSQVELTGYYRDSAVALITPIRDGMNLVAKEYVACQIEDPGVLIISPFTGKHFTVIEL